MILKVSMEEYDRIHRLAKECRAHGSHPDSFDDARFMSKLPEILKKAPITPEYRGPVKFEVQPEPRYSYR
jgi:hypothetical protein